jgi:hypothetical protein
MYAVIIAQLPEERDSQTVNQNSASQIHFRLTFNEFLHYLLTSIQLHNINSDGKKIMNSEMKICWEKLNYIPRYYYSAHMGTLGRTMKILSCHSYTFNLLPPEYQTQSEI